MNMDTNTNPGSDHRGMQGYSPGKQRRPWCDKRLPLAYNYVQGYYWSVRSLPTSGRIGGMLPSVLSLLPSCNSNTTRNRDVGFLRYWTFSQLPNFILVVPILVASIYGIYRYFYFYYWQSAFRRFSPAQPHQDRNQQQTQTWTWTWTYNSARHFGRTPRPLPFSSSTPSPP
jgi:hypothetical protein